LMQIVKTGLAIERGMGAPQDIEWCFSNGKLVVLQSRPITTL
jgi:pyruvate,water dikinase